MKTTPTHSLDSQHVDQLPERATYEAPVIESVDGPMATLLASGCQVCLICTGPTDDADYST